jgi:penicillin-binding protein 1A
MAIGGGCAVRPVEHANAYASIARGGAFKDIAYWLEVKNSSNDVIDAWEDTEAKQIVDPQVAYMVRDILHDVNARCPVFCVTGRGAGFVVKDVWTAIKTGTTENGAGKAKDSWFVSYSPVLSTVVWNGNHDGSVMRTSSYAVTSRVIDSFVGNVHKNVYGPDGKWSTNQPIERPAGLQTLTINGKTDIWPSWYNEKTSGVTKETMIFDSISKKLATNCTPSDTRVEVTVSRMIDPMTKKEILVAADGFDPNNDDDVHSCGDITQTLHGITISPNNNVGPWTIQAYVGSVNATFPLERYNIVIDGVLVESGVPSKGQPISFTQTDNFRSVTINIIDTAGYVTRQTQLKP